MHLTRESVHQTSFKKIGAPDRMGVLTYFPYFSTKTCCRYSLEAPHQGTSYQYPQYMFTWKSEKNINIFWLKKGPYLQRGCVSISINEVLFALRFYGPVNPMGSCRARSVYLTTRLLGRLRPLSG